MLFETMLGRVEEPAVSAIDQLLAMPRRINTQTRYDLSTFMAFQHVRGHRTRLRIRAMATEIAKLETRDVKDADIQQFLAEEGVNPPQAALDEVREAIQQLHDGNLLVQPQDFHAIAIAFSAAEVLAASIFERPWMVCMTEPGLITTDEPVLAIGGPGSPRTEGSGVAVAGIVAFPLSPERVLLAVRKDLARLLGLSPDGSSIETSRLDLIETLGLSRELLMSATRWAFEWPDRKVIDRLTIPTRPDDVSIEELASTTGNDSIVRHFNYTRWQNTDLVPDWPVAALWTPGWRSHPVPTWLAEEIEAHRRDLGSGLGHE
jgi:hypothetical protein